MLIFVDGDGVEHVYHLILRWYGSLRGISLLKPIKIN